MTKLERPSLDDHIREELQNMGGNMSKVARALGVDYHALNQRFGADTGRCRSPSGPEPKDIASLARPTLRRFVVAIKPVGRAWPDHYHEQIKRAQRQYDAGTHEMAQGHKDGWVILYSIPRLVHAQPKTYFSSMVNM